MPKVVLPGGGRKVAAGKPQHPETLVCDLVLRRDRERLFLVGDRTVDVAKFPPRFRNIEPRDDRLGMKLDRLLECCDRSAKFAALDQLCGAHPALEQVIALAHSLMSALIHKLGAGET